MNHDLPDIERFERIVFKEKDALSLLISFSLKLLEARHVGLLYGTNRTNKKYLAPAKWDRGVMHKFNGNGFGGLMLKLFGKRIIQHKGLSPIRLYKMDSQGGRLENEGIIPYVLRKHTEFYGRGIKVLLIDTAKNLQKNIQEPYSKVSVLSYNGSQFRSVENLKVNNAIVRQFKAENFVSAYVPDYGAIVFNTINKELMQISSGQLNRETDLKNRLNMLITAIEMASLAHIGRATGKQTAHIIWHKEKQLRRTALELQKKEIELESQRQYLRAVGAVNEEQLNMEAVNVPDGVYAFMDMVSSATIRKHFAPRDYFFVLNLCHQIAADNANMFACRVDNFMGDCVFLQNAAPFDPKNRSGTASLEERLMLMLFALSSILNQIYLLKSGNHPIDKNGLVNKLISLTECDICFRAGIDTGDAMVGPLGSNKRKIVTAIGTSVNNASRLESCGKQNNIHVSKTAMQTLNESYITRDTPLLWQILSSVADIRTDEKMNRIPFWEGYQKYFKLKTLIITEQKNISYKEFSRDKTYLIHCLPDINSNPGTLEAGSP